METNQNTSPKFTIKGVDDKNVTVELTEDQKNLAAENLLIHTPDGTEWLFFEADLPLIAALKKAHPNL